MKPKDIIKALQEEGVRVMWDEEEETWYFAVPDLMLLLTDTTNPRVYWQSLKRRLIRESGHWWEKSQSKWLSGANGKRRKTTVVTLVQLFRLIQSIRSPRAEAWKIWLARAGGEQVREAYDPERSLDRALDSWRKMGRSEKWILQRMMSQETRNKLTQYWGAHRITASDEFRSLTNAIHAGWSKLTVQEHKELKGLRSQNLRDHMSEAELIFTALAEMAVRMIAESRNATGYQANLLPAEQGSTIAGTAREALEAHTRTPVISSENFRETRGEEEKTAARKQSGKDRKNK